MPDYLKFSEDGGENIENYEYKLQTSIRINDRYLRQTSKRSFDDEKGKEETEEDRRFHSSPERSENTLSFSGSKVSDLTPDLKKLQVGSPKVVDYGLLRCNSLPSVKLATLESEQEGELRNDFESSRENPEAFR